MAQHVSKEQIFFESPDRINSLAYRMKKVVYFLVKNSLRLYNGVYFRRVRVYGLDQLPKNAGILFSPNHQCAFLDPLMVGCYYPKPVTSLTRSDVFGGPTQWFLDALQMLPVYRIRNGFSSLKKNEVTFEKCYSILAKKGSVMMFSEGAHHGEYYLQPLSKGSSRLMIQAQDKHPDTPMYIVPVGINFGNHKRPLCDVHLVFGTPISVKEYRQQQDPVAAIQALKERLTLGMKETLWLPENDQAYPAKKQQIHPRNTSMEFSALKQKLQTDQGLRPPKSFPRVGGVVTALAKWLNLPPFWVINKVLMRFEDKVFHASMKYILGLFVFPLWWGFLAAIIAPFTSLKATLLLMLTLITLLVGRQKILLLKN